METSELLKKVRRIEIKTRGLSRNIFAGQYHSAFKGRGMAFSEVREYQYGDDIRDIDWNVTARYVRPYVKVFEEERELTVMLLIDVSGSSGRTSRMSPRTSCTPRRWVSFDRATSSMLGDESMPMTSRVGCWSVAVRRHWSAG